jgi:hypothetical protein
VPILRSISLVAVCCDLRRNVNGQLSGHAGDSLTPARAGMQPPTAFLARNARWSLTRNASVGVGHDRICHSRHRPELVEGRLKGTVAAAWFDKLTMG